MSVPACDICVRVYHTGHDPRTLNLKEKQGRKIWEEDIAVSVADCNLGFLSLNDVLYPTRRLRRH